MCDLTVSVCFLFFDGGSPSCLGVLPCVDHVDAIDLIAMLFVAGLCETVCVVASSMLQAEVCVQLLDTAILVCSFIIVCYLKRKVKLHLFALEYCWF